MLGNLFLIIIFPTGFVFSIYFLYGNVSITYNSVFLQSEAFFELVIELIEFDGSLSGEKTEKWKTLRWEKTHSGTE